MRSGLKNKISSDQGLTYHDTQEAVLTSKPRPPSSPPPPGFRCCVPGARVRFDKDQAGAVPLSENISQIWLSVQIATIFQVLVTLCHPIPTQASPKMPLCRQMSRTPQTPPMFSLIVLAKCSTAHAPCIPAE